MSKRGSPGNFVILESFTDHGDTTVEGESAVSIPGLNRDPRSRVAALSGRGLTMVDEMTLIAATESAPADDQDGLMRFQRWERSDAEADFRPTAQAAYRTEPGLLVSDIAATGDGRLLVLERGFDSVGRDQAHLYLADLRGAAGLSAVGELGPDAPTVDKRLLAHLMALPADGVVAAQPRTRLMGAVDAMTVTDRNGNGLIGLALTAADNRLCRLRIRLPEWA